MSSLILLVHLATFGVYGYSVYFMATDAGLKKIELLIPEPLRMLGMFKFLTYQCLLMQLLNSTLHLGAHFVKALERPRDLVFTGLAYPTGSIVVYTFWAVWHLAGRELIFPAEMSQYYPDWLNHATHSIVAPVNLLLLYAIPHRYTSSGLLVTLAHSAFYVGLLHYIKFTSGLYVYKYLDAMNQGQRIVYFAATGLLTYLAYKSGQLISELVHKKPSQRLSPKKKQK